MTARSRHGLVGPYVLYAGLAHPNKRLDLLIGALAAARATLPAGSRLVLAGGHAEQSEAVRDAIVRERAGDLVVFAGRVSDDELAALYTGASAYVTATVSEGFGLPMLEACACGTQVIATDLHPGRQSRGDDRKILSGQVVQDLTRHYQIKAAVRQLSREGAALHCDPAQPADGPARPVHCLLGKVEGHKPIASRR